MVRMVAITASLVMSSQVGATAVRTRSAASANSSASRIQVANLSQIVPARHLVGGALKDQRDDAAKRLQRAEADDEHRRGLDDERDEAGDLLEIVLDEYGPSPWSQDWRGR